MEKKKEGWWIDPRLGFCQVYVAGGQGKEGVEGADERERWKRWALGVKLEGRAGGAGR